MNPKAARVIAEWTDTGFGLPRRRQYRLPSGAERTARPNFPTGAS
jgi:hypothetical protein